jgi:hypothetical protein
MKTRTLILLVILSHSVFSGKSQNDLSHLYRKTQIAPEDSGKLILSIENTNFLKNNEYFNNFYDGYTLIGYILNPRLEFYPSKNTKIEGGVHLLKYSGVDEYTTVLPTFTFQAQLNKNLDMVIGTIYGTANHKLIEPVFSQERYINSQVENGLQFLFHTKYIESDLWINWERFIFPKSPFKEEFTIGNSTLIKLLSSEKKLEINIPIQMLVAHKGGQIDTTHEDLISLANTVAGLELTYKVQQSFLKFLALKAYYSTFKDISHQKNSIYKNGNALYVNFQVQSRFIDFTVGYWNGYHFISPRGEPLFQSISDKKPGYSEASRELITSKFAIFKKIFKNIYISGNFEAYQDIKNGTMDYWYGCKIIYNGNFCLWKLH